MMNLPNCVDIFWQNFWRIIWVSDATRKNRSKYDPGNLFLKTFNYDMCFENEESTITTRKGDNKRSEKYNQ